MHNTSQTPIGSRRCAGRSLRKVGEAMSEYEMRICDTCAAFGPQLDHGQEIECDDDGACRFNPPQIFPMGDDGGFVAVFPPMNREDWCGRWVERKAVKR